MILWSICKQQKKKKNAKKKKREKSETCQEQGRKGKGGWPKKSLYEQEMSDNSQVKQNKKTAKKEKGRKVWTWVIHIKIRRILGK